MWPKQFILGVILLLSFSPLQAQSDSIDPAEIFAPSVEIRHIEARAPEAQPFSWDNDVQVFVVDSVVSHYPAEFADIFEIDPIDDTLLSFAVDPDRSKQNDGAVWLYSRTQHTLTPFVDACDVQDPYLKEGWNLADQLWTVTVQNNVAYLCNRITGEKSKSLPQDRLWAADTFSDPRPITGVSPDRRYVAFIGEVGLKPQPESSRNIEIYSYDTETQQIISLGIMEAQSSLYIDRWFGHQFSIATGETNSIGSNEIDIADVTKSNSLEYAIGVAGGAPSFEDNPPRYFTGYGADSSPVPCGRRTYYVETRQLVELDLGGLCHPEYGDIEGIGYYRDVPFGESHECCTPVPADVSEVSMVRYDTRTGERKELYRGEIEAIYWVSPDEHYAIILEDQNGRIDFFPYLSDFDNYKLGTPYASLVDLHTGKRLTLIGMETLYGSNGNDKYMDWAVNYSITPLPDGTFIEITCYESPVVCKRNGNAALRVTVTGDTSKDSRIIDDPIMLTPDKKGLFVWSQPRPEYPPSTKPQGVNIYDLHTGEIRPFIRELNPDRYSFELEVNNNESALVHVHDNNISNQDAPDQQYRVYFEPDGTEYIRIEQPAPSPVGQFVCVLTTETGVNLRVGPGGNLDRAGTAERGQKLLAVGQAVSTNDGLVWWQLDSGGWVRSDFVTPTSACNTLPVINADGTPSTPDIGTPEAEDNTSQQSGVTCSLTLLTGANLRSGPGVEFDKVGSAAVSQVLTADGQYANQQDHFVWWSLTSGEWVREDFVSEDSNCPALPQISP